MILLPNKHVSTSRSLVGVGGHLLGKLESSATVNSLWEEVKNNPQVGSFGNFVLSLDYLYAIGAIEFDGGLLRKRRP